MTKRMMIAMVTVTATMGVASLATAAGGWRPFATGADSGAYGGYANASADVQRTTGLAIRVGGSPAKVGWSLSCSGETPTAVRPGAVVRVSVETAAECSLRGSASSAASGTVRVVLLRR